MSWWDEVTVDQARRWREAADVFSNNPTPENHNTLARSLALFMSLGGKADAICEWLKDIDDSRVGYICEVLDDLDKMLREGKAENDIPECFRVALAELDTRKRAMRQKAMQDLYKKSTTIKLKGLS